MVDIVAMLPPMRDRLHLARRAAHLGRLTDRGLSPDAAERAIGAWEAEAASRGLSRDAAGYWDEGEAWALEERRWTWPDPAHRSERGPGARDGVTMAGAIGRSGHSVTPEPDGLRRQEGIRAFLDKRRPVFRGT